MAKADEPTAPVGSEDAGGLQNPGSREKVRANPQHPWAVRTRGFRTQGAERRERQMH